VLYRSDLPLAAAVERLDALLATQPELKVLLDFIRTSERSLIR
jgi:acyl-[acyl carrier protein]--UDP-N-acetylglucosamine O-acyltransferase